MDFCLTAAKGTAALACVGGAGYAAGWCLASRGRRPVLEPSSEIHWEAEAAGGLVRVVANGVWVVKAFYAWDEIAYARREGAAACAIVLLDPRARAVAAVFEHEDDCLGLLRLFRQVLYPRTPFTLHVLVNPVSGSGRAQAVYRSSIAPLFAASPHTVAMRLTTCRGDAFHFARDCGEVQRGDVIVCVGGDGVVSEVANGLIERCGGGGDARRQSSGAEEDGEEAETGAGVVRSPHDVVIAVVPAGTGNGLAASLGLDSVLQAAKAAARGDSAPLDAIRVEQRCDGVAGLPPPPLQAAAAASADVSGEEDEEVEGAAEAGDVYVRCRNREAEARRQREARVTTRYGVLAIGYGAIADIDVQSEWLRPLGSVRYTLYSVVQLVKNTVYPASMRAAAGCSPDFGGVLVDAGRDTQRAGAQDGASPVQDVDDDEGLAACGDGRPSFPVCGSVSFFVATSAPYVSDTCLIAPSTRVNDGRLSLQYVAGDRTTLGSMLMLLLRVDANKGEHLSAKDTPVESRVVKAFTMLPGENEILTVDGEVVCILSLRRKKGGGWPSSSSS